MFLIKECSFPNLIYFIMKGKIKDKTKGAPNVGLSKYKMYENKQAKKENI